MNDSVIWCETCSRLAPIDEWQRKIHRTRVVAGMHIVGYVSTYEHKACGVFAAVVVPRDASSSGNRHGQTGPAEPSS